MSTVTNYFNRLLMLVRREYWENKKLFIIPVAIMSIAVFLLNLYHPGLHVSKVPPILFVMNISINVVMWFCITFYLLGALSRGRRDNSVLFWQSLPIKHSETMLSKCLAALIVLPAITFALMFINTLLVCIFVFHTANLKLVFYPLTSMTQVYVLSLLLYFPWMGWFLFCSAIAKRRPLLWAMIPAWIMFVEIIFNAQHMTITKFLFYPFWLAGTALYASGFLGHNIGKMYHDMTHFSNVLSDQNILHLIFYSTTYALVSVAVGFVFIAVATYLRSRCYGNEG
jgi:ABC-2 type transport system permease protein